MCFNLFKPISYVVKSLFLSHVVNQNNSLRSFVVSLCDRSEALLSSSIPNLKLTPSVLDVNYFALEVNAYGGHVACGKVVVSIPKQHTTLSYRRVANDNQLDKHVILV